MKISTTSTIIPHPSRQPKSSWFVLLNSNCSLLRVPLEREALVGSKGTCIAIRWRSQWSIDLWQKCLFKGATPLASGDPSARKHSPVAVLHFCSGCSGVTLSCTGEPVFPYPRFEEVNCVSWPCALCSVVRQTDGEHCANVVHSAGALSVHCV